MYNILAILESQSAVTTHHNESCHTIILENPPPRKNGGPRAIVTTWIPAQAGMDDLERFLCITDTNFHLSEQLQPAVFTPTPHNRA